MTFLLCSGCRRHVKDHADACPFCGESTKNAARSGNGASGHVGAGGRARNKILFAAAATAVAATTAAMGCSSSSTTTNEPAKDSGADTGADSGLVAAYGGPVFDSGTPTDDAGNNADAGSVVAAYGGPPPQDGGTD